MNISISTVKRRIDFIDLTIESIQNEWKDSIHLMVGGNNFSHVEKYTKGFKKTFLQKEEKDLKTIQKAGNGFYKSLTLDRKKPILIIEDDVILKKGWREQLEGVIKQIKTSTYMISLLRPFDACVANANVTTPTVQEYVYQATLKPLGPNIPPLVRVLSYCNTSATYYSKGLLQTSLPEFIKKYAVHGKAVYDLALGSYLFKMGIPIYVIVPNMAVNVGGEAVFSAMGDGNNRESDDYSDWVWEE